MRSAYSPAVFTRYPTRMVPADVTAPPPDARLRYAVPVRSAIPAARALLLEQGDGPVPVAAFELEGQSEAHDSPAHDQEVRGACCGHGRGVRGVGRARGGRVA